MTPDCPYCGERAVAADRDDPQWWACPDETCGTIAFIDDDAPLAEDPRNPQAGLDGGQWS